MKKHALTSKYAKEPFLTYALYTASALSLTLCLLPFWAVTGEPRQTSPAFSLVLHLCSHSSVVSRLASTVLRCALVASRTAALGSSLKLSVTCAQHCCEARRAAQPEDPQGGQAPVPALPAMFRGSKMQRRRTLELERWAGCNRALGCACCSSAMHFTSLRVSVLARGEGSPWEETPSESQSDWSQHCQTCRGRVILDFVRTAVGTLYYGRPRWPTDGFFCFE